MYFFDAVSKRLLLIGLGLLVATLFAPGAKADSLDFACGAGSCTGTVVASGGNFSSTGIGLASNFETDPFNLMFDTSTSSIQLVELTDPADVFTGTITGFSSSSGSGFTNVDLSAYWTSLPADVNGIVGVTPFTFILSMANAGQAFSVDVPISTPEPSALVLLGVGVVSLGLLLKFKDTVLA
jgi:hypothetical protein